MSSSYNVSLSEKAVEDIERLDGSIKKLVVKQLQALRSNPFKGESLGSKAGIDLNGCYKLYVHKKQVRIVYQVIDYELLVFVVGIGKRENLEVYKEIFKRLQSGQG
ncbi:MAG: type II toxin-antitoxin system RelE/ParE family toxin [Deferribacterales bacterium]